MKACIVLFSVMGWICSSGGKTRNATIYIYNLGSNPSWREICLATSCGANDVKIIVARTATI
jgi:hypothetical protein